MSSTERQCERCGRWRTHHARGMCNTCYHYWRDHGDAQPEASNSPDVWDGGWVRDGLIWRARETA